ncbi:MAG: universal stress protein [Syntrophales bacterium]|jgi:nucleotide-binding universal stress UspA family protein|nr:universal stress protein [Syntrophales bacterium]
MFAPKNILVPTDFSKYSSAALDKAVDIATQYKANIYLLHVITEQIKRCMANYCLDLQLVKQLEKQSIKGAKDKLKREADTIAKERGVEISIVVREGVPQEVILNEQKAKKIDLIVIASHGETGILKNLMGSVADKVVKGSKCPVIVVKP